MMSRETPPGDERENNGHDAAGQHFDCRCRCEVVVRRRKKEVVVEFSAGTKVAVTLRAALPRSVFLLHSGCQLPTAACV